MDFQIQRIIHLGWIPGTETSRYVDLLDFCPGVDHAGHSVG